MNIGGAKRRVELTITRLRDRFGWLDHVMAMLGHYGRVNGSGQAGAVTYFAFLAFFPVMALAFFAVGVIANIDSDARENLTSAINDILGGEISLRPFQDNAGKAGVLGLLGFVYAGLGWMSAMSNSLMTMFDKPPKERPNIFVGKARDLLTLVVVGLMMLVSIAATSAVSRYSKDIIEWAGLDPDAWFTSKGLQLLASLVAIALTTTVLMVLYQLLARPRVSRRALLEGALFAAIGFELLKLLAAKLISITHGQPAFTVFGFSLVLLVIINYFSRIIMYGAAWAYTSQRVPDLYDAEPSGPHWRSPAAKPATDDQGQ